MITKEQLDALRERHTKARTQKERDAVSEEIARLCEEDAEAVARLALDQVKEDRAELAEMAIREQLQDVLPSISLAYIAKTYFNKTRAWLYQRINGLKVNGKPARFTPEEIETLNYALKDIGGKLSSIRIS